jgi:hypothetical protein
MVLLMPCRPITFSLSPMLRDFRAGDDGMAGTVERRRSFNQAIEQSGRNIPVSDGV